MTYNEKTRTIKLRRIDICDILLALGAATIHGEKWAELHDKVLHQLEQQDEKDPCGI